MKYYHIFAFFVWGVFALIHPVSAVSQPDLLDEPEVKYRAAIIPSDIFYSNQWYLQKIGADKAWNMVRESPQSVIAVIDTGVQISHPDIKDNIWQNPGEISGNLLDDDKNGYVDDINGWDFITNAPDPNPKFTEGFTENGIQHGTIVAGIAAAAGNNAAGVTGVTWKAKIMSLRVLDGAGEGITADVVEAIDYAVKNGADIINLSFVGFTYSRGLDLAIERAHKAGVIVVAAAGNEQDDGSGYNLDKTPVYPACNDGPAGENRVIGVASVDAMDQKARFSSYGANCIDITAPGAGIFSTVVQDATKRIGDKAFLSYYDGYWSGTSVSAPMVSGAFALLYAANPSLTAQTAKETLLSASTNISRLNPDFPGLLGRGRLNLERAVEWSASKLSGQSAKIVFSALDKSAGEIRLTAAAGSEPAVIQAFAQSFNRGIVLAAGDIDGDGRDEIIAGAGPGGGPQIRIFKMDGRLTGQFFAFKENFRGGVNVAAGDIDGDGRDEIIAGAGPGGGPHVRIYESNGRLVSQFFAFKENFRGGVKVAAGKFDPGAAGSREKIIAGAGPGGGPQIRVFDQSGRLASQFFAFNQNLRSGLVISAGDSDGDGLDEIIVSPDKGASPHVRAFQNAGILELSFYGFDQQNNSGISAVVVKSLAGDY